MFRRPWRIVLILFLFIMALGVGAVVGVVAAFLRTAPTLDEVTFNPEMTTYIYDVHGREIARLHRGENRIPVPLSKVPQMVQDAFIAIEDHKFYEHHGIYFRGLLRSLLVNIRAGSFEQGGGTITGLLARNAFLSHEKTITRKIKEWVWTIQIERKYSKEEILETFLNEIYFGHSAYGVEAAAQTYFGKSISEVTLPEAAFLAGVINGPGYFSPHYDMEAAVRRRNIVLNRMAELGYITQEEAEEAKATPLEVIELQPRRREASYFVEYILQTYLIPKFGDQQVYAGGLRVYTTLDLDLQRAAEQAVISLLPAGTPDAKGLHQPQAALVSLDPQTGHILAMVGGRGEDQFNRATSAVRQPGSAIKPFVFALALEQRDITPATVFVDEPVEIPLVTGEVYKPSNFGNVYRGPLTVREALERSVNVVAVQVLLSLDGTMKRAVEFMKELGISTLVESGRVNDMVPALALGGLTRGVTPLEMAAAYATFANNGIYVEPIGVLRVEAYDGTVLDEPRPERRVVLSEEASYLINDMLRGVIEAPHGTGRAAADLGRPAAGKTGTSQGDTNAWFVGYTPDLVTSVWIGNDQQSQPLDFGSRRAVEIWTEFMAQALADRPPRWFERPPGVVQMRIDTMTGLRVPDGCVYVPPGETRVELFIEGTEPMSVSPRCFGPEASLSETLFGLP
ncbi:MAG: PBP1A family penicillin-binding protein [Firmicutes bacterium]|nr:PBP1A family penicillin-binding protein [Bacillota bacterium]